MEAKNITVNISLAGEIDMDKIRQEFDKAVRAEIDRVGINVEVGAKKEQPLKVGDYAKVADHVTHDGYAGAGDIVKIVAESPVWDFRVSKLEDIDDDDKFTPFDASELVLATDEEIAEAKRLQAKQHAEQAIADKWAKIGRKPNEFKKGDIVRGERATSPTNEKVVGELEDIGSGYERCHGVRMFVNEMYFAVLKDTVELITPVEHRFDLSEESQ
jgi:hypothetical protein